MVCELYLNNTGIKNEKPKPKNLVTMSSATQLLHKSTTCGGNILVLEPKIVRQVKSRVKIPLGSQPFIGQAGILLGVYFPGIQNLLLVIPSALSRSQWKSGREGLQYWAPSTGSLSAAGDREYKVRRE